MDITPATSRLGIDLGGTKIEAVLLNPQGQEIWRKRIATPHGHYQDTLAAMTSLVAEARNAAEAEGLSPPSIGIGTPGAISRLTGRIKNANSTDLNGQTLIEDLESLLGSPVRSANDANCMLVSETSDGAAAGAHTAFGVILGTGVGGALAVEGQVLEGHHRIAGEWGHNPLPWVKPNEINAPLCYCGRRGCNETWLSGPGMLADYRRQGGQAQSAAQIVAQATQGQALAQAHMETYYDRLARSLASVINFFDPEVIVLAGGLSNISALYTEVPKRWGAYVFSDSVDTRLCKSAHGDSSGVRGAAWLWGQAKNHSA
jgi:fructokinase